MALKETNLNPQEVVHIGDSLNSGIRGASNLGINTIWMNRNKKEIREKLILNQDMIKNGLIRKDAIYD